MKRTGLAACLLVLVILMSSLSTPVFAGVGGIFPDVNPHNWFFEYVLVLKNRDIIQGYPDATFRPNNNVIRKHAAKMIALSAELDTAGQTISFKDFKSTDDMAPYVAALVKKGAIQGYPDGTFRPDQPITRGHVCKIVVKAFDLQPASNLVVFIDYPEDQDVSLAIRTLASKGIVKGYFTPEGTAFRPNNTVTRAQLAKILCLSMAVTAVEKAKSLQTVEAAEEALKLVDSLSSTQDGELKYDLTQRLITILDSLKEGLYGDYYWRDVETVNRMIAENNLAWSVWLEGDDQPPVNWETTWTNTQPARIFNFCVQDARLSSPLDLNALTELG